MTSTTPNTKQELREKLHTISRDTFWILGSDEQKKDADFRAHVILTAEVEMQKLLSDTVNKALDEVSESKEYYLRHSATGYYDTKDPRVLCVPLSAIEQVRKDFNENTN